MSIGVITLAAAFIAGYAARYVVPEVLWWLQLVALALPVLAALVVLVGLVAALAEEWWLLIAFAPLIVLAAVRFLPAGLGSEEAVSSLTVMGYNAGASGGGHTSASFRALVERAHPDVLALQEVSVRYFNELGAVALPGAFGSVLASGAFMSTPPEQYEHSWSQPVFVRSGSGVRIRETTAVTLGSEGRNGERSYSRVEMQWEERVLVLYNVHLHSFDQHRPWEIDRGEVGMWGWLRTWRAALRAYREDFVARTSEARRLREAIDAETLPVIIAGDFNSTVHQWVYAHLAENLQDAISDAGVWRRATFPASRPLFGIDHVLVSPHWQILGGGVVEDAHADHRPVVVRLGLAERSG